MLDRLLRLFALSCRHQRLSVPFAANIGSRSSSADWEEAPDAPVSHYVVCLDCGAKFAYDWKKMKAEMRHPLRSKAS